MGIAAALGMLAVALSGDAAPVQSLTVLPVTIQLKPGETAATLTIINEGDSDASVQIRAMAWSQPGGTDQLAASNDVMISPPLATIAPRAAQVVRVVLGRAPVGHEGSYRILVDQVPPKAVPGTVRIALRLSIPVFAEPSTRTAQQLRYKVERQGEQAWLVATNDGTRHAALRNIALTTGDGRLLKTDAGVSPYILPGATHRWAIVPQGPLPAAGTSLMMTAGNQAVDIRQPVTVVVRP